MPTPTPQPLRGLLKVCRVVQAPALPQTDLHIIKEGRSKAIRDISAGADICSHLAPPWPANRGQGCSLVSGHVAKYSFLPLNMAFSPGAVPGLPAVTAKLLLSHVGILLRLGQNYGTDCSNSVQRKQHAGADWVAVAQLWGMQGPPCQPLGHGWLWNMHMKKDEGVWKDLLLMSPHHHLTHQTSSQMTRRRPHSYDLVLPKFQLFDLFLTWFHLPVFLFKCSQWHLLSPAKGPAAYRPEVFQCRTWERAACIEGSGETSTLHTISWPTHHQKVSPKPCLWDFPVRSFGPLEDNKDIPSSEISASRNLADLGHNSPRSVL